MFNHLQTLSPAFFHRTSVGRIMSRSQNDVHAASRNVRAVGHDPGGPVEPGRHHHRHAGHPVATGPGELEHLPLLFLILGYWQRFARHSFMRIRHAIAMVNGEYNQNITGIRVVQSLNRQQENLKHFRRPESGTSSTPIWKPAVFPGHLQPIVELLTGIGLGVGVILVGGLLLQRGQVSWGVLVAFALWVQRFFEPIRQLTMQYSQLQRAMAAGVRIFELLDVQPEVRDAPAGTGHADDQGRHSL